MNEITRLELLKQCNTFLNEGMIEESDFNNYKKNLFSSSPNMKFPLDDLKDVYQYYVDGILSKSAYTYLKDQFFDIANFKTIKEMTSLSKAKTLLGPGMINGYDYESITNMLIKSKDKKTDSLISDQLFILDEYYPLISKGLFTRGDYEILKNNFVAGGTNIKPDTIKEYFDLYKKILFQKNGLTI